MLLMIDNYDSFTYNLVQYFSELGEDVHTYRNDEITLEEIATMKPDRICISPGPCTPLEAGISVPVLKRFAGEIPYSWRLPWASEYCRSIWWKSDSC